MRNRALPIIVAVLLAGLAGAVVFAYARSVEDRAIQSEERSTVLVTSGVVAKGMTLQAALDAGLVESVDVPQKLLPAGSVTSVGPTNAALVAVGDLSAGQVVLADAFQTVVPTMEPIDVPAGLMAVTVSLEVAAKVGSFLRPGSYVAIFNTVTTPAQDGTEAPVQTTTLLLDRVEVLAVGAQTSPSMADAGDEGWTSDLVTVAVDELQAEALIHGTENGAPYLALLSDAAPVTSQMPVRSAGVSAGTASADASTSSTTD